MSVVRREKPASPPRPSHLASVEDLLRDAACFASQEEVPAGLAHRALARQIAQQSNAEQPLSERPNRKRGIALWLGGLSAGTLTGASAAVLILAHLNGNILPVTPESTALSTPTILESQFTPLPLTNALLVEHDQPEVKPRKLALETAATKLPTAQFKPVSAGRIAHRETPSVRPSRVKQPSENRTPRTFLAAHTVTPPEKSDAQPKTAWKTEPFEETEYQLVTTAYVTPPQTIGNSEEPSGALTPVQMRIGLEPKETSMVPISTSR
jgi:hypothetical protein